MALVHVETSVTLIYIWGICEATDSLSSLPNRDQYCMMSQEFVKMCRWDQWLARASRAKMTPEVWQTVLTLGPHALLGTSWLRDGKQ